MLALSTGVSIEPVRTRKEYHFGRHISILFVLSSRYGGCDKKQDKLRNAHFVEHFEI